MTGSRDAGRSRGRVLGDAVWVVAEAGEHLAQFLDPLVPEVSRLIGEGRVFVDGVRARAGGLALAAGAVITVSRPRVSTGRVEVLGRRGGLVAVAKPAGVPTEPDHRGGVGSVRRLAAAALGVRERDLHAATRLDAPVSGVVLLALGAAARRDLERWRAEGRLVRRYLGLAATAPRPPAGAWDEPIGRRFAPRVATRLALTRFATVTVAARGVAPGQPGAALLALAPATGRTHQLRIHAAAAGSALLGDVEHGGPRRLVLDDGSIVPLDRVALHAARLTLALPDAPAWEITARIPAPLRTWWARLGGDEEAWSKALTVAT